MCGGMISESGQGIDVVYGQADPSIVDNALSRHHNGCRQRELATITCVHLSEQHKARGGRITQFLASDTAYEELSAAVDFYFNIEPAGGEDSVVWENGFKLLAHINPIITTLYNMRRR